MSLGANDALGVPSNKGSIFPTRIKLTSPTSSSLGTVTYASAVVNVTNGQMEWLRDVTWGDRIVIKQAGIYSIKAAIRIDSTSQAFAISKNMPAAFWATAPTTLDDQAFTTQYILTLLRNPTASAVIPISVAVWCDAGDYIQVMATAGVSASDATLQSLYVEKLGG